jgi:hypothetical protein
VVEVVVDAAVPVSAAGVEKRGAVIVEGAKIARRFAAGQPVTEISVHIFLHPCGGMGGRWRKPVRFALKSPRFILQESLIFPRPEMG